MEREEHEGHEGWGKGLWRLLRGLRVLRGEADFWLQPKAALCCQRSRRWRAMPGGTARSRGMCPD